ncbi:hypothetical protein FisN_18Hh020 [Fistulifera solaris]|uniref:FPL domain-containing protein n=1 Tax=Fistulifera solaris TaxID=1519565 RepID=A0A1Z5JUV9_FISSO|nr:hypothetical protein FisN_18Hh020 [Fistulifera solaris]|eukprot:GAX17820.1 hypothetical protein FisN_18Hh020 [Fistulifera solaris]
MSQQHENVVEEFKFVWNRLRANLSTEDSKKVLTMTPQRKSRWFGRQQETTPPPTALYVTLTQMETIVEDLRRLAELVVMGENAVTAGEKQKPVEKNQDIPKDEEEELDLTTMLQYHAQLFDLFIEEHVLSYMVDLVLGTLFSSSATAKLLPPLPVATQAIQSISILIQNVSQVTSLYLLLSSDTINRLSQELPLDDYLAAERYLQLQHLDSSLTFASPALTDFATHFVTLLKSLAMRVTPETLQFFVQYPAEDRPALQFPLYDRALEFCAAHHDSFVRTTALNICLNVLRLTTVDEPAHETSDPPALPVGVLHTSYLPFSDRLLIAQYACLPRRVEPLIAPIFTKLAERWNALEEHLREIPPESSDSHAKASLVKHQVKVDRWLSQWRNQADQLHDELLFLQDVFQVGLTSLNEQLIEMMLATFVYPLQLQPLLLYCKCVESPDNTNECDIPSALWAPAQAALFTIAACFHFLEHPALLKLLWVAFFHPLSPDSTSVPTIRAQLQVESVNEAGRPCLRMDSPLTVNLNSRETYPFGSRFTNAELPDVSAEEACVFVLAPALQQVLAFRGDDLALLAKTKPNPYRQAWLTCLQPSTSQFSMTLRHLAIGTLNAAVQALPVSLVSSILLGTDLQQFHDDMPIDERDLDSTAAHIDDRGLGSSNVYQSRHALTKTRGVGTDHMGVVVSRLATSVVYQSPGQQQIYDATAAHALIYLVYTNPQALKLAAQSIDSVWRHAAHASCRSAALLRDCPTLRGAPSIQDPRYDDKLATALMDMVVYGTGDFPQFQPGLADFLMQSTSEPYPSCTLAVWSCGTFPDLIEQIGKQFRKAAFKNDEQKLLEEKRTNLLYIWQLDAFASLLRDLSATQGVALRSVSQLTSLVRLDDGTFANKDFSSIQRKRQAFATLSPKALDTLFCEDAVTVLPEIGSTIDIVGALAVPCVCEAPPKSALPIAEGVSWLSLYLVPQDSSLLFVQQDMKLLMACPLERVWIVGDPEKPADDSSARKLLLQYTWIDTSPPPLFLFDNAVPKPEIVEQYFSKMQLNTSTCIVWFENQTIADSAMSLLIRAIFMARSTRGERIQRFFSP